MTSGTGTCSVEANQAGNGNYAAASQATETVEGGSVKPGHYLSLPRRLEPRPSVAPSR